MMDRLEPIEPRRGAIPRIDGSKGLSGISADERRRQQQREQERREQAREQYERSQGDDEDEYYEGEREPSSGPLWNPQRDRDRRRAGVDEGDPDNPGPHIDISA